MVLRILRIAFFSLLAAGPVLACRAPSGSDAQIPIDRINQAMLSRAILAEVNHVRCQKGRRALALAHDNLTSVALGHSTWMASAGTMSHVGGRDTGRTLTDRVRRAGLRPATYAENLAFLPRYRFGGKPFKIADRSSCRFMSVDGNRIGQHSYGSLAREVVRMWMQSPGHRRNLLDPTQRRMSAAASLSAEGFCGRFYVTQIFTG